MTSTLTESSPKRRDKLVIMAEIVGIAKKGTSKTNIMFKANLSFSQLNQYLTLLSNTGLLEKVSIQKKVVFRATAKGLEFMDKQQQVFNLINEDNYICKNYANTNSPIFLVPNFQASKRSLEIAHKESHF
jgi:predicted transcriptional regulator